MPPCNSCSAGHNASIAHLLSNNEMSLIARDINVDHSRLDTNTNQDKRGEELADEIDAADYTILNENEATRLPTNGWSTTPDISLASNYNALLSDWSVPPHLPAIICPWWWWWWCRQHPVREHAQDLRPPLGARPASPPTRQAAQLPPRGPSTNPRPLV